jgi:hypothetical protein
MPILMPDGEDKAIFSPPGPIGNDTYGFKPPAQPLLSLCWNGLGAVARRTCAGDHGRTEYKRGVEKREHALGLLHNPPTTVSTALCQD